MLLLCVLFSDKYYYNKHIHIIIMMHFEPSMVHNRVVCVRVEVCSLLHRSDQIIKSGIEKYGRYCLITHRL